MNEQKIEAFWREATAEDVMNGKELEARFRDDESFEWSTGKGCLIGYKQGFWISRSLGWKNCEMLWRYCQVYDPPQWYTDKPDPGEGWRLLEKFPDEEPKENDQFFDRDIWLPARLHLQQIHGTWYRRRIEPVKQDAGSPCASSIPKGWAALLLDEPRLASDAFWSIGAKDWVIIDKCRVEYANRDKWPAIRQVETHKTMMLMEGCFYMLPNGHGIKVTKQGFEVF